MEHMSMPISTRLVVTSIGTCLLVGSAIALLLLGQPMSLFTGGWFAIVLALDLMLLGIGEWLVLASMGSMHSGNRRRLVWAISGAVTCVAVTNPLGFVQIVAVLIFCLLTVSNHQRKGRELFGEAGAFMIGVVLQGILLLLAMYALVLISIASGGLDFLDPR
jgi:hypothetical protein